MELFPEYCNNIIVGVIYKKTFSWYVTKIGIWYLDYDKYYKMLKQQYIDMERSQKRFEYEVGSYENFCGSRWGIKIVDSDKDINTFISKIEKYKASCTELKEYRDIADDISDYYPVLLVDFDKKCLYNYIQEPYYLQEYVPKGWKGKYDNFYTLIPQDQVFFQ